MPVKTKKIVVTGGPGTGKTSVIKYLETANFYCYHEVIREMTKSAMEKENIKSYNTNPLLFVSNPEAFNKKILSERIQQFKDGNINPEKIIFYDRGIPDVLAYMDFFKQDYGEEFINACKNYTYDQVFIFPPWEDIYVVDNERSESFEEVIQIHQNLMNTYQIYGYNCLEVPFGNIKTRAEFILKNI